MENDTAKMNDQVDIANLSEITPHILVEESALSHDSEFDDLPGFPETTNVAENENEELNSLDPVQEEISQKGNFFSVW